MNDHRRNAYRYLLYWAMLDIRQIEWLGWVRGCRKLNPLSWRRQIRAIRFSGALADWMHNLAFASSVDFEGFNEDWFWRDFEAVNKRYPDFQPSRYRELFEGRLRELEAGSP